MCGSAILCAFPVEFLRLPSDASHVRVPGYFSSPFPRGNSVLPRRFESLRLALALTLYQKSGLLTEISRRETSAAGLSGLSLPDAPCEHTTIRATAANLTREDGRLKVRCYARLRIRPADGKSRANFRPQARPGSFKPGVCLWQSLQVAFDISIRYTGIVVEVRSAVEDCSFDNLAERLLRARQKFRIDKMSELLVDAFRRVLHLV